MGFKCHCCNKVVSNETQILVPAITRKVEYLGYKKIVQRNKEEFLKLETQSRGWEIVKELPIAKSHYDEFIKTFTPTVLDNVRTVKYIKTRQKKEKLVKKGSEDRNESRELPEKFDEIQPEPQQEQMIVEE